MPFTVKTAIFSSLLLYPPKEPPDDLLDEPKPLDLPPMLPFEADVDLDEELVEKVPLDFVVFGRMTELTTGLFWNVPELNVLG
ncbi:MAG: hypothetical protein A2201_05555 [Alicyclobacillus sp. RIFOXYA1_FULL_53_8]|nr:MAG: hypothetical protein A2201_05555 [Alicyclobacillus sp. RIFOXYA1_FULL_53_8]